MCGIAGFFKYNQSLEINLEKIIHKIKHRGPDSINTYYKNNVGFAHARLSIIDLLDRANQPLHFDNLSLVYNGEIYNYKSIRRQLVEYGYQFKTDSDSEVVLKAYHYWKEECVKQFNGMFAIAIYDHTKNELTCFRDRIGIKPFYYLINSECFIFASEAKALYELSQREFDAESIKEYFNFGYIGKEGTVYKDIRKLKPGHVLKIQNKTISIQSYWKLNYTNQKVEMNDSTQDELESILDQSFTDHMLSDVPVGILLSGGIDSSILASMLSKKHERLNTFTMGFDEQKYNEAPFAKNIASHLKTNHNEKILSLKSAKSTLLDFYSIFDEPFADSSGIPTTLISQFAREKGCKVLLSADGGDELFAGYDRYQTSLNLWNKLQNIPPVFNNILKLLVKSISSIGAYRIKYQNLGNKLLKFKEILSADEYSLFYQIFVANISSFKLNQFLGLQNSSRQNIDAQFFEHDLMEGSMLWDFHNYLPDDLLVKMDRSSMMHGVEARVPLLDHRVVEHVFNLSKSFKLQNGITKVGLKNILDKHLSPNLINQKKMGFSIPIYEWFSSDLDSLFNKYLSKEFIEKTNLFDFSEINSELNQYKYFKSRGMRSNIERMWRLLSFMMWFEKYHLKEA